jgi:Na+-driven multidrug efflux pump
MTHDLRWRTVTGLGTAQTLAWASSYYLPAVLAAGRSYLRIVGTVYLFQGVGLSLYFASQGAGTVAWPVAAGVLRMIVTVGGAAVAVRMLNMGLKSIFVLTAAGMALYGAVTALSILFGAWRTIRA